MFRSCVNCVIAGCLVGVGPPVHADEAINPEPRPVLTSSLARWDFTEGAEQWVAEHHCSVAARDGWLVMESSGDDPFLHCPVDLPGGLLAVKIRMRSNTAQVAGFFWTTDQSPTRGQDKQVHFPQTSDGQWHEYVARFEAPGQLNDLRFDPSMSRGRIEVDWIEVVHEEPHPLTIARAWPDGERVQFEVRNDRDESLPCVSANEVFEIAPHSAHLISRPEDPTKFCDAVSMEVTSPDLPSVRRAVFTVHPEADVRWHTLTSSELIVRVAADGSGAMIVREGVTVATLAPLVHCDGVLPDLSFDPSGLVPGNRLCFHGDGLAVSLELDATLLRVKIESQQPCEGPVVRVAGALQQGLLPGLEYLGQGERSSTKLDIETAEHLRFLPDRLKVTMPVMAVVTSQASVALAWDDMHLQPVFATPNFFDGTDDHRMALRGHRIEAVMRFGTEPLEELILWAVRRHGLPPWPTAPRSAEAQRQICLRALNGPLKNEAGWGHCVQPNWERRPFADVASTVYRLSGEIADWPNYVPGGAHVPNSAIYFLTGHADQWLQWQQRQAAALIQQQRPDGSYRYDGEYRRGHFEDTASGVCARPAAMLLEFAYATGDEQAMAAGLRTLEFMKRFRTPRGAQVWEVPLHTPDQLASAYLVWAYVRGYELTGNADYLTLARKWALSGIPFTYLWDCYPIMRYSTPPVFGATFWRHSWFGLPVQWVGGVYAYTLTMLAPHDDTLDWNHLARGILLSGEQQQYPDGEYIGLLPDSFHIAAQRRQPADINPCGLMSLRLRLDGQLDSLSVGVDGKHRIVAPFPVSMGDGRAVVQAPRGTAYQVLIDGRRIVDVAPDEDGIIELEPRDDGK